MHDSASHQAVLEVVLNIQNARHMWVGVTADATQGSPQNKDLPRKIPNLATDTVMHQDLHFTPDAI